MIIKSKCKRCNGQGKLRFKNWITCATCNGECEVSVDYTTREQLLTLEKITLASELERLTIRDELLTRLMDEVKCLYGSDGGLAALQDGHTRLYTSKVGLIASNTNFKQLLTECREILYSTTSVKALPMIKRIDEEIK